MSSRWFLPAFALLLGLAAPRLFCGIGVAPAAPAWAADSSLAFRDDKDPNTNVRFAPLPGVADGRSVELRVTRDRRESEYTVPKDRVFVMTNVITRGSGSAKLQLQAGRQSEEFTLLGNDRIDLGYPAGSIYGEGEKLRLNSDGGRVTAWVLGYEMAK
ncbi:MAG: hypothetical protein KDC38_07450 [Planctomycetes bacterium]|nr:hypothetical protein [Planctomycetota bacterium]